MTTEPTQNPKKQKKTKSASGKKPNRFWRVFKWLFGAGFVLGVFAIIALGVIIIRATKDLPGTAEVEQYKPAVMSRVHAGDGKLIAEYGIEKRVFVPIGSIPKEIHYALVASEDKRFYTHDGFDPKGFARAMAANVKHVIKKERLEGGSTLTQQVARHFLKDVGKDRDANRKIREIFMARRIEKVISKDEILELYLNDMYFGRRAYGIAGAALNYFNKPLDELTLGEMAYLAGLVKGPNNYQPEKNMEKAINRRNYVLTRMAADGYITNEQADTAKQEELVTAERLYGDEYLAAEYFVSAVRKEIFKRYGEDELNKGGLSIRTTLDTKMQLSARRSLRRGLEMYDRRHGYRGPLATLPAGQDWKEFLSDVDVPLDIAPWRVATVLDAKGKVAELGFAEGENGTMVISDINWAKPIRADGKLGPEPKAVTDVVSKGDIILVEVKPKSKTGNEYNLRQVPEVNGGIIAMDPHTGRILALVGGYSFKQSQFNRATQAYRQPGSAFKPFVYAAALDNGFTPASQVLDAPFVIEHNDRDEACLAQQEEGLVSQRFGRADEDGQIEEETPPQPESLTEADLNAAEEEKECGPIFYKPANFNAGKWYGMSTLRLGLEKSRNAMTVRLASDIGMGPINNYGRRFGIYEETKPELAWSLGAGETTLMRMAAAYAGLVNGGKKVTPTLLDRVQDSNGKTVYLNDGRTCPECRQDEWLGGAPPELPDERDIVISPVTAYQITSMLEGVVQHGTGGQMRALGRPIAGKTGTTNDFKDAWFVGFSPDLVTAVYVGYDRPRSLGTETGAKAAGPIFRFFMGEALADKPKVSFRIPDGVLLAPINRVSGEPSYIGAPDFIFEAFKPGTEPQLGVTQSKINIGSGSGDFEDYDFGFGPAEDFIEETDDVNAEEKPAEQTQDAKKAGNEEADNADEIDPKDTPKTSTSNPRGKPSDTPEQGEAKPAPVKPVVPVKTAPKNQPPKPKPVEETEDEVDLDDGLY